MDLQENALDGGRAVYTQTWPRKHTATAAAAAAELDGE